MGRWLNRIEQAEGNAATVTDQIKNEKSAGQQPYKTDESTYVGYVGTSQGAFPENTPPPAPRQNIPGNASPNEVSTILAGLSAAGRHLGNVEPLARLAMLALSRAAATELVVAMDDAFTVAADDDAARAQCRCLLNDPHALAAAKAVWPDLPSAPADAPATTRQTEVARPVVDHAPRWLRLIRERCPLLPEDESLLRRHLGRQSTGEVLALAERYAAAWHQAADDEPRPTATANAGRRAANTLLRQGVAPTPR